MKGYRILIMIIIILIITYFLVENSKIGGIIQETVVKEVIPHKLSKALAISWERILIIKSERIRKGWTCYLFTLSCGETKEFFVATVFDPSQKIDNQIDYFTEAKSTSLIYLGRLAGLDESYIKGYEIVPFEGCEVVYMANLGFLVLRLKNVQINRKPLEEYL